MNLYLLILIIVLVLVFILAVGISVYRCRKYGPARKRYGPISDKAGQSDISDYSVISDDDED